MTAYEIIERVELAGGILELVGDRIRFKLPAEVEGLLPVLREQKPALIELLRSRGGRVANFPHCPRCASYALYRQDNVGLYECQTCELHGISEQVARRVQ